ncbi:MAG TPA: ABC transporter permease [Terracidiphilus sp.]|nr:ABC transporter permease [Terracidiphilus sp.]
MRTILTLSGIGMAVGAFVGLVGFSTAFEQQWMRIYSSSGTDLSVIHGSFLNTTLDESAVAKIQALPMAARVSPTIFNLMDVTASVNALVYGWNDDAFEFDSLKMVAGRRVRNGQREVMIGDLLAQDLNKKPGDTIDLQGTDFSVAGIYHASSTLETAAIVMPLGELQQLSGMNGKVSAVDVRLRPAPAGEAPDAYMKRAQAAIQAVLPGARAVPAAERASSNQFVKLAQASAWGTSALALLIGILGIANTMAMSVFERTREIGILRALGWKQWQVLAHIEIEAALLGLGGGILGIGVGWCALYVLARLPQTASFFVASIEWPLLVKALCIAVVAGLIAGAFPAWRAGKLSPVDALHSD